MMAISYLITTMFQATGHPKQALTISIFRKATIDIPLMFLFNHLFPLYGLMMVQPIVDTMSVGLAFSLYRNFSKELNKAAREEVREEAIKTQLETSSLSQITTVSDKKEVIAMEYERVFLERRSVRAFAPTPIEEALKAKIRKAILRAPTAGNLMLYSVIEIEDEQLKARLAETCDHQPFIAKAPWVLVFLADYRRIMDYFDHWGVWQWCEKQAVQK